MDWRVTHALEVMRRDFHEPLTVSDLARQVNLSVSRFAHLFQQEIGCSPARYLRTLRLDEAHALATRSALSVKEIMARVGFNDPSHFARDFKRRHGASPRKVRARARSPGAAALQRECRRVARFAYEQQKAPRVASPPPLSSPLSSEVGIALSVQMQGGSNGY